MKLEKLTNESHEKVKVLPFVGPNASSGTHSVQIIPQEFEDISKHYPIFFIKDSENGKFRIVALLGLEESENLFLVNEKWQGTYLPLFLKAEPFYLIEENIASKIDGSTTPAIAIDISNPRVQENIGKPIFHNGFATDYLKEQAEILSQLINGTRSNNDFIELLLEHNLLESMTLDITLEDGKNIYLQGLYSINKEKLLEVPKSVQKTFEESNYVHLISNIINSLNNVGVLIEMKNKK